MKIKGIKIPSVFLLLLLSTLGYVIGVSMMALWQDNRIFEEGIFNQDYIYSIEELYIDKRAFFILCLGRRLKTFCFLFLLGFSTINIISNLLFFVLYGFFFGCALEILIIKYGIQGMGIYCTMTLPQGIFYFLGYLQLGCWCLNMENTEKRIVNSKMEKIMHVRNKGKLVLSLGFIILGVLLESFLNFHRCFS